MADVEPLGHWVLSLDHFISLNDLAAFSADHWWLAVLQQSAPLPCSRMADIENFRGYPHGPPMRTLRRSHRHAVLVLL